MVTVCGPCGLGRLSGFQCLKVAYAGHNHRDACLVGGCYDVGVFYAPAGLHDGGYAFGDGSFNTIWEREKRIGGQYAAYRLFARFFTGTLYADDPSPHLACTNANGAIVFGQDDCV